MRSAPVATPCCLADGRPADDACAVRSHLIQHVERAADGVGATDLLEDEAECAAAKSDFADVVPVVTDLAAHSLACLVWLGEPLELFEIGLKTTH